MRKLECGLRPIGAYACAPEGMRKERTCCLHRAQGIGHGAQGIEHRDWNLEWGMRNEVGRSWKAESSRLKAIGRWSFESWG